jgi:hypothetical protein
MKLSFIPVYLLFFCVNISAQSNILNATTPEQIGIKNIDQPQ